MHKIVLFIFQHVLLNINAYARVKNVLKNGGFIWRQFKGENLNGPLPLLSMLRAAAKFPDDIKVILKFYI